MYEKVCFVKIDNKGVTSHLIINDDFIKNCIVGNYEEYSGRCFSVI